MPFEETARCWKDVLEGFLEFGFSRKDIEFELLEERPKEHEQFRLFDSQEEAFVAIFTARIFEEFLNVNERRNGLLGKLFDPQNNFYSKIGGSRYQIVGNSKADLAAVQRAFAMTLSEYRAETINLIKQLGGDLDLKSFLLREVKASSGRIYLNELMRKFSRILDCSQRDVMREINKRQRESSEPGHEAKKNRILRLRRKIRNRVLRKLLNHFWPDEIARMKVDVHYEKRDKKTNALVKQYVAIVSFSKLRKRRKELGLDNYIEVKGKTAKEIIQKLHDELPRREE